MGVLGPLVQFNLLVPLSLLGLLPKCTISIVRWFAAVYTQPHDLEGLMITSWLYGQLVTQSLDISWPDAESLPGPNSKPENAFQMVKLFLLKMASPYSRILEVWAGTLPPTGYYQRIYNLFLPQIPLVQWNFPGDMAPWTCCRAISCIPKCRICCLQNRKRPAITCTLLQRRCSRMLQTTELKILPMSQAPASLQHLSPTTLSKYVYQGIQGT